MLLANPVPTPYQGATGQQGADVVHVQQQQTAQQEQAKAGDRGDPAAQMIGQSSQHQQRRPWCRRSR